MDFRGRGYKPPASSGASTPHNRVVLVSRGRNSVAGSGQGSFAAVAAAARGQDSPDATSRSHDDHDHDNDQDDDGSSSDSSTSVLVPSSKKKTPKPKNANLPPSAKSAKPPSTVVAAASSKPSEHSSKSPEKRSPSSATAAAATDEKDTPTSNERSGNDALASASAAVAVAAASKNSPQVNGSSKQAKQNSKSISTTGKQMTSSASVSTPKNWTGRAADGERKLFKKYEKSKVSKSAVMSAKDNEQHEPAPATTAVKKTKKRKQKDPPHSAEDQKGPDHERKMGTSFANENAEEATAAKSKKMKKEGKKSEHAKESKNYHSGALEFKPKAKQTNKSKLKESDQPYPSKESSSYKAGGKLTESSKKKSSKSNESKKEGPIDNMASVEKSPDTLSIHRDDVESPSSARADYQDGETLLSAMKHFGASTFASTTVKNITNSKQPEENGAAKDKEETEETLRHSDSKKVISSSDIRHSSQNNSGKGEEMGEDNGDDMDEYADEYIDDDDNDEPKLQLDDEENNPITQEISYHGVTFRSRRKKFQARLYRGCREHNLGLYDLAADAALAYDVGLRICDAGMPNEEDLDESIMVARGDVERQEDHKDLLGGLAAKFLSGGMLVGDESQSENKEEYDVDAEDSSIEDENAVVYALDWLNPRIKHNTPLARRLNAKTNEFNFLVPSKFREARAEEIEDLRQGKGLHSYTQQDFGGDGDDEVEPIKPEDLPDENGLMKKIQKEVLRLADGYLAENPDETDVMTDRLEGGSPMESDSDEEVEEALNEEKDCDADKLEKKNSSTNARLNQGNNDNDNNDAGESAGLPSCKRHLSVCEGTPLTKKRKESSPREEKNDDTEGIDGATMPGNLDHVDREQQVHNLLSLTSQHKKRLNESKKKELAQKLSAIMKDYASPSQLNSMQNHTTTSSVMTDSLNAIRAAATACINRNDGANTADGVGGGSRNASESGIFLGREPLTANMLKLVQLQQQRMRDQEQQQSHHQSQQQTQQQQKDQQTAQQQHSRLQTQEHHQPVLKNQDGHSGLILSATDIANLFNLVDVGAITMDQLQQLLSSYRSGESNANNANTARQVSSKTSARVALPESLAAHSAQVSTDRNTNQFGMKESDRKFSTTSTSKASPLAVSRPATHQGRNQFSAASSNEANASDRDGLGSSISLTGFNGSLPPDVIEQLKLAVIQEGEESHTNYANNQAHTSEEVHAFLQKQRANEAKKAALAQKLSALMGGVGNDKQPSRQSQPQHDNKSFGFRKQIAARASENQSTSKTQNTRESASTNAPDPASHDPSRAVGENTPKILKSGDSTTNERKAGGRRAGSATAQDGHQHSIERANTSSARPPSSIRASNTGLGSGIRAESRNGQNQEKLNGPDLPLSNSLVARAAASNASTPSNATDLGHTSLSSRLQTHVQSLQAAGLPENMDPDTLRNLLMRKHCEERSTPVTQTLEMRLREVIGREQHRPPSQQDVAQGSNDTASFISRQLRQLDEDQERNLLQSLLHESGSTTTDNDQMNNIHHALLQNILSNQQRNALQSPSQNQTHTNSTNDGVDATSFDFVNRRVAIETILSGDESRLTELREALQEQYANQQNSSFSLMNQLNLLGTNQSSIPLETLMNRENAMTDELRNALILERLAQGNAGNNNSLNNARLNELDRNNQLTGLHALLLQNSPQGVFGGVSQDANVHREMLLALTRGGGDSNIEELSNLNSGNNDGLNPFALLQARIQQVQGNNDGLGTLAQLLGLSRGNDADRVESGNNSFRRHKDGNP